MHAYTLPSLLCVFCRILHCVSGLIPVPLFCLIFLLLSFTFSWIPCDVMQCCTITMSTEKKSKCPKMILLWVWQKLCNYYGRNGCTLSYCISYYCMVCFCFRTPCNEVVGDVHWKPVHPLVQSLSICLTVCGSNIVIVISPEVVMPPKPNLVRRDEMVYFFREKEVKSKIKYYGTLKLVD